MGLGVGEYKSNVLEKTYYLEWNEFITEKDLQNNLQLQLFTTIYNKLFFTSVIKNDRLFLSAQLGLMKKFFIKWCHKNI